MHKYTSEYHWGEYRPRHYQNWFRFVPKTVANAIVDATIKMSAKPKKYYPCINPCTVTYGRVRKECTAMNPCVIDTIKLLKHSKQIQALIDIARSEDEENVADRIKNCPPFPELTKEKIRNKPSPIFEVIPDKDLSNFAISAPVFQTTLENHNMIRLLKKTVAVYLAFLGFDNTTLISLNVFTNVVHEFITKFIMHLKYATEDEILRGPSMYADTVDQVFHKMGLGSIRDLGVFYKKNIIQYREKVREETIKLVGEYQVCCALLRTNSSYDIRFIQNDGDINDIPEIHFPSAGLEDLQPSLDSEFQMLDMLEQDVS